MHITTFRCKVTRYDLDLRPVSADFEVMYSNGSRVTFTKSGAKEIDQVRSDLNRKLAERARGMQ